MATQYQEPNRPTRAANAAIRWLAEMGVSIAGTHALRIRGRKTGKPRSVVVNLCPPTAWTTSSHRVGTRSGRATSGPRASLR